MKSVCILVYTNETNIPILELFLKYLFKYNTDFNIPIYVAANSFTKKELPYSDKVTYLSGNVSFHDNGGHFSQTLSNILPQINEDYIFYFCDDYLLTNPIDISGLENLLKLIQDENVDMFTFGSICPINHNFIPILVNSSKYEFESTIFYQVDNQYRHAFNVQPCIWTKTSLQQLLLDNPEISLHDLDNSILENKDHYKIICTNYKIYDVCCPPEYFIIGYIEIIRHGAFLMTLNGHDHLDKTYQNDFLKQLIKENNLHNKPEYDRYICFDKSLITW